MTSKQYDSLLARVSSMESRLEAILDNQVELTKAVKELTSKTVVISDVNKQIEQLQKDVQSLQDEGVM